MSGYSTTDTFSSLIDEVVTSLQGWGVNTDQMATLSQDVTSSATTFNVDESNIVSRGIIEIDEELIWVSTSQNGNVVVPAWGRGWKGTSAASHALGTPVYVSPTYPRSIVSREVNNAIRAVYPTLFAVATQEFTVEPTKWQYELPASTEMVLAVEWKWDAINGWRRLDGYEVTHSANVTDFPSGKMLSIADPLWGGVTIRVTYSAQPTLLSAGTDPFTVTGLPSSSRDVVVYGATSRLLPWLDAGRLPVESVATDVQDQAKPVGNAINVGRELRSLYAARIAQERTALLSRYPIRVHKVR